MKRRVFTMLRLVAGTALALGGVPVLTFPCHAAALAVFTEQCPGDGNADEVVDVLDLLAVLGAWGPCDDPCPPCAEDTNGDCVIDVLDLLEVLGAWGPCPCDPSGTWVADQSMTYACVFGVLQWDIQSFTFTQTDTTLTVTGSPVFHSFQVVEMTGDAVECGFGETILVSATLPGGCTETYTLSGTFITEDQFVATFTMEFKGGVEECQDCVFQEFTRVFNRD